MHADAREESIRSGRINNSFTRGLQAAWLLKCRALTKKSWIDDLEIDEEGVADILMGKAIFDL